MQEHRRRDILPAVLLIHCICCFSPTGARPSHFRYKLVRLRSPGVYVPGEDMVVVVGSKRSHRDFHLNVVVSIRHNVSWSCGELPTCGEIHVAVQHAVSIIYSSIDEDTEVAMTCPL